MQGSFFSLLHGDDELRISFNVWSFSLGLAWTAMGGEIMFVEATRMGGEGKITLTGQLGRQSRSQRPRSFWLVTGIATSGQVQLRKSAIHGLPVTLRMLRVKSDKSDWFWSQSIVFTQPFKTGMSLGLARGPDISSA